MKFSITKLSLFGVACGFFSSSVAFAQVPGQPQGGTQGFGSTAIGGATGAPGAAIGGATATSKYGFGAPGSGATGAALVDYSNTNAVKGFSTSTSAGGQGATNAPSAFGANAFSNAATGVQGAQGGFNMNSLGAGLGAGLGANLGGGFGAGGRAGGLGGIGGLAGGLGGQSASNQAKKKIRVSVSPDIELARSSIATQSNGAPIALARLKRIPLPASLRGVNASLEGDLVVLTGTVATESDKKKVERLVKLEPGLNSVRNDVVVRSTSLEKIQARPNR